MIVGASLIGSGQLQNADLILLSSAESLEVSLVPDNIPGALDGKWSAGSLQDFTGLLAGHGVRPISIQGLFYRCNTEDRQERENRFHLISGIVGAMQPQNLVVGAPELRVSGAKFLDLIGELVSYLEGSCPILIENIGNPNDTELCGDWPLVKGCSLAFDFSNWLDASRDLELASWLLGVASENFPVIHFSGRNHDIPGDEDIEWLVAQKEKIKNKSVLLELPKSSILERLQAVLLLRESLC